MINPRKITSFEVFLGNQIRLERIKYKISQRIIAKELDITPQQVQKYEMGINKISILRFVQIANLLRLKTDLIFWYDSYLASGKQ